MSLPCFPPSQSKDTDGTERYHRPKKRYSGTLMDGSFAYPTDLEQLGRNGAPGPCPTCVQIAHLPPFAPAITIRHARADVVLHPRRDKFGRTRSSLLQVENTIGTPMTGRNISHERADGRHGRARRSQHTRSGMGEVRGEPTRPVDSIAYRRCITPWRDSDLTPVRGTRVLGLLLLPALPSFVG